MVRVTNLRPTPGVKSWAKMSWFTFKPHEFCTEALKAIADWWGSWGRETEEYYELKFGNLTIHLYSSLQTVQREYKRATGHDWNPVWDGLASAPGKELTKQHSMGSGCRLKGLGKVSCSVILGA